MVLTGYEEIILGSAGIGLFAMTFYYNLLILNNFKEHEEFSLTKFFLDRRGPFAFQLVSFSAVIFSFGMLYAALGIPNEEPILGLMSKSTSLVLFITLLYFLRHVARITSKPGEFED